jgi:hypothetical protein
MTILRCLAAVLLLTCSALAQYPYRWVYVSRSLQQDSDVDDFRSIARVASEHGLTGVMLSASFDNLDRQGEAYLKRLAAVRQIAQEYSIEIIPLFFSPGYAGGILAHNRNLAEGLAVEGALYVASEGEARFVPDPPVVVVNGSFEQSNGNTVQGYRLQDSPGVISFVDYNVAHGGRVSLRFENFTANPHGHGRIMQEIPVHPNRCYRVTAWVKTQDLEPATAFRIKVLTADGQALAAWDPKIIPTTDWRKLTFGFNSGKNEQIRLYAGTWGAKSGKFWIDDWQIEEVGLINVLCRGGTPIRVTGAGGGTAYLKGMDFASITDPQLNFRFDHDASPIRLLSGSRISEGERLRVSYYHGISINDGQVSACMSEPETFEILARNARLLHELLAPKKYMLSIDEIRSGGSCEACKRRNMTMGQVLGNFLTRGISAIKMNNPDAEVFAWSDMLDPNHNAHGGYYLVDGDFTGSWENIPGDLRIVCWYYAKCWESLKFFAERGFKTLAGAYYDGDDLTNPKGWLEALRNTPGALGIMYTTWENRYGLLSDFGDLVSSPQEGPKRPVTFRRDRKP